MNDSWQAARAARAPIENPMPPRQLDVERVIADNPHIMNNLTEERRADVTAAIATLFRHGIWDLDDRGRVVMTMKGYMLAGLVTAVKDQPGS